MKNTQMQRNSSAAVSKTTAGEKVKIRIKKNEVNEYFMEASERARRAKWISFGLLVVFLLVNLIFFRENITYSNVLYLLRDLDTGTYAVSGEFAPVTFGEENDASFALYKGKLAVSATSGFTLYNSTASVDVEDDTYMQTPAVVCGEKYAVTYDMGGNAYSVFNTMGKISGGNTEEIIEDCAVSDAGNFVLLQRSREAKYIATFYNSKLRASKNYYRDTYVVDLALDKKGENLAMISANVTNSGISCEIMLAVTSAESSETVTVKNAMPMAVKYIGDKLVVLCDSKVVVLSGNQIVNEYSLSGSPVAFSYSDDGIAVVCSENAVGSESSVHVLNSDGSLVSSFKVNEKIEKTALEGTDTVYLLYDGKVEKRVGENVYTKEISGEVLDIVPYYGKLMICRRTSADVTEFN